MATKPFLGKPSSNNLEKKSTSPARTNTAALKNQQNFAWEGKDKTGRLIRGEMRAAGASAVRTSLRKQGVTVTKVRRTGSLFAKKVKDADVTLFTRQLATMLRSGVPLLQSLDIVARGSDNPAVSRLLMQIKNDIETGNSLSNAFRKHPLQFDGLYCNLVGAGEQAGILDQLLDRLAQYKERIQFIKKKIKKAMFYPVFVIGAGLIVTGVMLVFVIPKFKEMFQNMKATLPAPTEFVLAMSEFFKGNWYWLLPLIFGIFYFTWQFYRRSQPFQRLMDRVKLQLPLFGKVFRQATLARWARTLSTMFAAGVPLVEALDAVAGAAGNQVYKEATRKIQQEVSTGVSLTTAMQGSGLFPVMMTQMTAIGEEAGSLDAMLEKVADFYEEEVSNTVDALASLMEPLLIIILGVLVGGMVVAMYLPIFKLAATV